VRALGSATEQDVVEAYERAARDSSRDHHGWRTTGLFDCFPERLEWTRVAMAPNQILSTLYIDWSWWLELSGGSRRPLDAAARSRTGGAAADLALHRQIAARPGSNDPPPELIAVTNPTRDRIVLVDGHVRLTAYALFPELLPAELELFLGESAEIDRWPEF
jgi:hypothetical protein